MCSNFYIKNKTTILIFDTGIGGLSIYNRIKKTVSNVRYIYYFDNEQFPYGEKDKNFIINRVINIISALLKRHRIDCIIIACNTVSVTSLPILKKFFSYPIFGVIPAIELASKLTRNHIIGLLATKVTINQSYVYNLIKKFAFDCLILKLKSNRLVNAAENKLYGKRISMSLLKEIFLPWLTELKLPDTIILGCTHFSFIKSELKSVFPKKTHFVDSSTFLIKNIKKLLLREYRSNFLEKSKNIKNIAYCSIFHLKIKKLMPILLRYGFHKLKIFKI